MRHGWVLLCAKVLCVAAAVSPTIVRPPADASLYEAYNELHVLSQKLKLPVDSPTVVVVGRQTDGKSALVEALMGFQFNHVGGGTKTRRPIALQMQYHPAREQPVCYLHTADGEKQLSLADLQAHIEAENVRLERAGAFATDEIVVRIEYRYCPNLSIVDTPGLLSTADDYGGGFLQAATTCSDVEQLVMSKIASPEAIILCVEETNNWDVAAARAVVARVDADLLRTVVVSTKLDTKFAQFGSPSELAQFLDAAPLHQRHAELLGGPFFTSVPAGRVGGSSAHRFRSHGGFQSALQQQEAADLQYIKAVLPPSSSAASTVVGVSRLRSFLEALLRKRYVGSLHTIVPRLLHLDSRLADELRRLEIALEALTDKHVEAALREAVRRFMSSLQHVLEGAPSAAAKFGQTLDEERAAAGGRFTGRPTTSAAGGGAGARDGAPDGPAGAELALFGGAQYYRLLSEFRVAVRTLPPVTVTGEDISNAMGLAGGYGAQYSARHATAIALERAVGQLRPLLQVLFTRVRYVLSRMLLHVRESFVKAGGGSAEGGARGAGGSSSRSQGEPPAPELGAAATGTAAAARNAPSAAVEALLADEQLWQCLSAAFDDHLSAAVHQCMSSCEHMLGEPGRVATLGVAPGELNGGGGSSGGAGEEGDEGGDAWVEKELEGGGDGGADARRAVLAWRRHVSEAVARKVHTQLVLSLLDTLPATLAASVASFHERFDMRAARERLEAQRAQLHSERAIIGRMAYKFEKVARAHRG